MIGEEDDPIKKRWFYTFIYHVPRIEKMSLEYTKWILEDARRINGVRGGIWTSRRLALCCFLLSVYGETSGWEGHGPWLVRSAS